MAATIQQSSPGVAIREIDLSAPPASFESVTAGGFVGQFDWGPVGQLVKLNSIQGLLDQFYRPSDQNYVDWFSARNYLLYSNNLWLVRVVDETSKSATRAKNASVDGTGFLVKNKDHYQSLALGGVGTTELFVAKYPGLLGNGLVVTMADSNTFDTWDYNYLFDDAPGTSDYAESLGAKNDEIHILVIDGTGKFTGVPGEVLEKYEFLSKAADAKNLDHAPIFYGDVINNKSNYVWYFSPLVNADGTLDIGGHIGSIDLTQGQLGSGYGNPIVTITGGGGRNATAQARLNNGAIQSVTVTNPGSGYTTTPTVTITEGGSGATAYATVVNGAIETVTPMLLGTNYGKARVTVSERATGFAGTAVLSTTGSLKSVVINDAGTGYAGNDILTVAGGTGGQIKVLTVDGSGVIVTYEINTGHNGTGYSNGTDVAVTGGGGSNATFDITTGKAVSTIQIVTGGSFYDEPVITIGFPIDTVSLGAGGTGYAANDILEVSGGVGGKVKVLTVSEGGVIATLEKNASGTGYATLTGRALRNLTRPDEGEGGTVDVVATEDGSGASAVPTISTVAGVEGVITAFTVTGGTGYVVPPEVRAATGSGATVTATIGGRGTTDAGKVIGYTVTASGDYYNTPRITVVAGGAGFTAAQATATIVEDNSILATNWATPCKVNNAAQSFYSIKIDEANDSNWSINGAWSATLSGGSNGNDPSAIDIIRGWYLFKNTEQVDVRLLFAGDAGGPEIAPTVIRHITDYVVKLRKDCMLFFSPNLLDVLNKDQNTATDNVVDFVKSNEVGVHRFNSYLSCDSGWKLMYDAHNAKYRWVPLNPDIAGLCARNEDRYGAWFSPAGMVNGRVTDVVSLAFNPNKESRDTLYKSNINPVVSFTGEGTVLYGDKTLQLKNTALSYINVRRLLIALEKYIGKAAKQKLFQFNDEYTRTSFVGIVDRYLRTVKANRGVYDYEIICDETNNTPTVIDNAQFVADIFIKPSRSINYITLNFVIVRTGVEFSEVIGKV